MKKLLSIFFLIIPIISLFSLNFVLSISSNPPTRTGLAEFNVSSPINVSIDTIFLNWTTSPAFETNVTIAANNSYKVNISVDIINSSSTLNLRANYSQSTSGRSTPCQLNSWVIHIKNSTGFFTSVNNLNGSSTPNAANISVTQPNLDCAPGRYWTDSFIFRNSSNSTENLNMTLIIDIPISNRNNAQLQTTGLANFSATLPANARMYQSFYFNATSFISSSDVGNATSVTINLTGWNSTQDVDIFLFDANGPNGKLIAKSIRKNATNETLTFNYLPISSSIFEIRIYGNSTGPVSYNGTLIFSTLNLTNATDTNLQISKLEFGSNINATNTTTANLIFKNEGNFLLNSVKESSEIYLRKWFTASSHSNFSVLVPDSSIVNKLRFSVNWTGAANYSLNVYAPNGSLVLTSTNKYTLANITNATQEEFNETDKIVQGFWILEVKNNTAVTNLFTASAQLFVPSSSWLFSNFSASGFTFNVTGGTSSTYRTQINLTVPNNTLDGNYEGSLKYTAASGSILEIPFNSTVKTGILVVNQTINSTTIQIDENVGANLTKVLNITLNNTGSYALTYTHTSSSGILRPASTAARFINFSYIILPANSIGANTNGGINITIPIWTNGTNDTADVYEGWIFINATESHPYQGFNLSLKVNLTKSLDIRILQLVSINGSTMTKDFTTSEAVTVKTKIFYVNGTEIEGQNTMNTSNITVFLQEGNLTGGISRIPSSGHLAVANGSSPKIYNQNSDGLFWVNFTVPSNQVGGLYEVRVAANFTKAGIIFSGENGNRSAGSMLLISNPGLNPSAMNSTSITLDTSTTSSKFVVNITNYGPADALSSNIYLSEGCDGWSADFRTDNSGCTSITNPSSGTNYTFNLNRHTTGCLISWTIFNASTSASACSGSIIGLPTNRWFNNLTITVTVSGAGGGGGEVAGAGGGGGVAGGVAAAAKHMEFIQAETLMLVTQGSSNSTTIIVKNTNDTKVQDISLSIDNIAANWYSVSPTSVSNVGTGKNASFILTFNIPNDTNVADYSAKYKAKSALAEITKDFTLRVLPGEEKKKEINLTLDLLKVNFTKLWTELNNSKQAGLNISAAEGKFEELRIELEKAENFIKRGDYFNAYQSLNKITLLFAAVEEELIKAKKAAGFALPSNLVIAAVLVAGVVGAIVLAYLFWPTKEGGYKFQPKE